MGKSRSTTLSDSTDEYLDLLCDEYGVSKSSLMAELIDIGLNAYVRAMLDRSKLAAQFKSGLPEPVKTNKGSAAKKDKDKIGTRC